MVLDIGTGDGAFVYQSARWDPSRFYIGVDAEPGAMEKSSAGAHRRPEKGGVPNALFLRAAAEALPSELDGVADEIHVHFPWGSLLRAVLTGDKAVLQGLRRVARSAPGWRSSGRWNPSATFRSWPASALLPACLTRRLCGGTRRRASMSQSAASSTLPGGPT